MELSAFEYVTRKKLRFSSTKGPLALEDLWDLTSESGKTNLNDIAKSIHRNMKEDETSFVEPETSSVDPDDRIMLEAIKRIIAVKVDERKTAAVAREKAAQKQEIMEALAHV
jgi:hypothetical protein